MSDDHKDRAYYERVVGDDESHMPRDVVDMLMRECAAAYESGWQDGSFYRRDREAELQAKHERLVAAARAVLDGAGAEDEDWAVVEVPSLLLLEQLAFDGAPPWQREISVVDQPSPRANEPANAAQLLATEPKENT